MFVVRHLAQALGEVISWQRLPQRQGMQHGVEWHLRPLPAELLGSAA
jgi:hypothetical protein